MCLLYSTNKSEQIFVHIMYSKFWRFSNIDTAVLSQFIVKGKEEVSRIFEKIKNIRDEHGFLVFDANNQF